MLRVLTIENIGVIDRVEIPFGPGLNVVTGATGAGKSIIVDSIGLLLGARADAGLLRAGATVARVEGVFEPDDATVAAIPQALMDDVAPDNAQDRGTFVVVREIGRDVRSVCRVNGRVVALKTLAALGRRLADLHGQRQTHSLLRLDEHRDMLDRFGHLTARRRAVAESVQALGHVRAEIARLARDADERARRVETLRFQVDEIGNAGFRPDEEESLRLDRARLANAERLGELAHEARAALVEESRGGMSGMDALAVAARAMGEAATLDPTLEDMRGVADAITEQAQDVAHALGRYAEEIEADPDRLNRIEERVALIDDLKRKYGESLPDVIEYGDHAAAELEDALSFQERATELDGARDGLLRTIAEVAEDLSRKRQAAAVRLADVVEHELAQVALAGTRVCVQVTQSAVRDASDGHPRSVPVGDSRVAFDETGIDQVEFQIAPNPGEPLRPLAKTASGGEMARLMLALKVALARGGGVGTLVFDEIDAGVGGHVGGAIGKKLAGLGNSHQVICVTHLPQAACFADRHIRVSKSIAGARTMAAAETLEGRDSRVEELAAMLGSDTESSRRSVAEMLDGAEASRRGGSEGPRLRLLEDATPGPALTPRQPLRIIGTMP